MVRTPPGKVADQDNSPTIEFHSSHSARLLRQLRQQRRKWAVPVTQPLLMCSQIQRSGGTLLLRLFDGHPSCFAHPNELRWGRPNGWPRIGLAWDQTPAMLFDQVNESWPAKFARYGYAKVANSVVESDRLPFLFDQVLQLALFEDALPQTILRRRDVLNAYLTSLFNAWLDYQHLYDGPKRWVTAFEPRFLTRGDGGPDVFFTDYPDGMLVSIVREPSAWLSSYQRHIPAHSTEKALRLWTESVEMGLRAHTERPDRVIVLLFRDLVHHTERVMRYLCERMDIPFDRSLLTPTFNSIAVRSDSSHTPTFGIDPLVDERHRQSGVATDPLIERAAARYEEIRSSVALNVGN